LADGGKVEGEVGWERGEKGVVNSGERECGDE